ncbi:PGF-pre-PGF domain-containing protein [Halobaculum litoreum]|uniref:PGF-pre-PGF domain-containing protein n=1 Tax=Halobaculum litoreum TaxID=3031998 RepID=A0ABD5XSM6_9EURY
MSKETLADRGVAPEDVQLYRYHDGSWNGLATSVTGESPDAYTFRADSPGLSMFAIGERGPGESTNPDAGGSGGAPGGSGGAGGTGGAPPADNEGDVTTPTATATPGAGDDGTTGATESPTATATPETDDADGASGDTATATADAGDDGTAATTSVVSEPQGFALDRIALVLALVAGVGLVALYRRRQS